MALTSQCPLPHDRLTDDERARAVEQALTFSTRLESSGDFRAAVEDTADRRLFVDVLRSPQASPLLGIVAPTVLEEAPADALRDYYLARANVQLSQIDASEGLRQAMRSRRDSHRTLRSPRWPRPWTRPPVRSPNRSNRSTNWHARADRSHADEQAGAALRRECGALSHRAGTRGARARRVAHERSTTAKADPRLVRAVAVELPNVRLILVPDGTDFRVASAVPWGPAVKRD